MADNNDKKIVFACSVESLNDLISESLKPIGYEITFARNSKAIIEKLKQQPGIILVDVQMEAISVKEIIAAIKKTPAYSPKVVLFSFFIRIDAAENSEKHYFYTHFLDGQFEGIKDIYYMGAFSKETAKEVFVKAVLSRLSMKTQ